MWQDAIAHCGTLTFSSLALWGGAIAVAFEMLTIGCRFGLGMQSTRDTRLIGLLTFRLRIHHGYIGVLLCLAGWWLLGDQAGPRNVLTMLGVGLIVSDLVHHFCVLWLVTGAHEFDLVYPRQSQSGEFDPTDGGP